MKTLRNLMTIVPAIMIISTSIALGQITEKGSMGDVKMCSQMEKMGTMGGMNHESMSGMHKSTQSSISKMLYNKVKLNLDQKQLEKFRFLDTKTRKEVISKKTDIYMANLDLIVFLESTDSKNKDIEKLVKKISSLEADIRIKEIRASREAYGLLSLEQRSEYNVIKDKKICGMMSKMMDMDTEND